MSRQVDTGALLGLMLSCTVIGLWVLAQPLVESGVYAHPTATTSHPERGGVSKEAPHHVPERAAKGETSQFGARNRTFTPQTLTPEQAKRLLLSVDALDTDQQTSTEISVQASVLCSCLAKAPHAIQALRRSAAERFREGVASFKAHKYEEAVAALTSAAQLNPRQAKTYINRGLSYGKIGHYQEAIQDFTQAIALDPQQTEAYYARSLAFVLVGDRPRAVQDRHRAAQLGDAPAFRRYQGTSRFSVRDMHDLAIPPGQEVREKQRLRIRPGQVLGKDWLKGC